MGLKVEETGTTKLPKNFTPQAWQYNPSKTVWYPDFNKYDDEFTQPYVNDLAKSDVFKSFYNGETEGNFPIAVINREIVKNISAETNTALLSSDTLAKNMYNHPDITFEDYQSINEMINSAQVIVQDGLNILVFIQVGENCITQLSRQRLPEKLCSSHHIV